MHVVHMDALNLQSHKTGSLSLSLSMKCFFIDNEYADKLSHGENIIEEVFYTVY